MKKLFYFIPLLIMVTAGYSQTAKEYFERGIAKDKLQDYKGAIADYTKSIELDPNHYEAFLNRGLAKKDLNDNIGAITDFTKAIEINPKDESIYFNRAIVKGKLKDARGAIADYNESISINPKYATAYYCRGIEKIFMGQKDSGCLDLSKAGELGYAEAYDVIKDYCN